MSNLPALCASDLCVVEGDAEPRVQDLRLAERLGFERPRKIRELIERNLEGQVVRLCTLSKTPLAAMVTKEAIDVFLAYRHGRLAPRRHCPSRKN